MSYHRRPSAHWDPQGQGVTGAPALAGPQLFQLGVSPLAVGAAALAVPLVLGALAIGGAYFLWKKG